MKILPTLSLVPGLLLAFLLLYPPPSGWDFDNTFTALKTLRGQGVAEVWEGIGKGDAHPPGYYLLYKAWMALGGYDPLPPGVPEGAIRWSLTFNLLGFALMAGAVALAGAYLLGLWGGSSPSASFFSSPMLPMPPSCACTHLPGPWRSSPRWPTSPEGPSWEASLGRSASEESHLYLDKEAGGRLKLFQLHLPGLEDRVRALGWLKALELCGTDKPPLFWRYNDYRPDESPVQRVLECLRGRVRVVYPTPVGTLYLYLPEGYQSTSFGTRNRQR